MTAKQGLVKVNFSKLITIIDKIVNIVIRIIKH